MKNNYKLKTLCLLCVITAAFSSCKKNELAEEKALTNNHNNFAYTGHPKYHVLGYGYDVTKRLANAESSTIAVLNIEKFVIENPGLFSQNDDVNDYFEYSYGENAESYSNKLTQKYHLNLDLTLLKVAKLFKGELNASFAKKDSVSSKYVYATVRKMIKQRSMKIYFTKENLINNYLTEQFKIDLTSLSAIDLVKRYGTHVLTDIELGARLDMNYEAQTNNSKREEAATAGASISVGKFFNVTADLTTNSVDANSNYNQKLYYNSVGGDGSKSLIGEIALDNSTLKINIGNWQSSCTRDNAALINIGEDGLIPLEDLISDPVKKAEVKNYINQYYQNNQFSLLPTALYEYYNGVNNRHAYSLRNDMQGLWSNYYRNGEPFKAFSTPYNGAVPLYQFYDQGFDNRVLTTNRNPGLSTYRYDGIICYVYTTNVPGSVPVYEFYNPNGGHLYTTNRNTSFAGWRYNGQPFYAFPN